MLGQAENLMAKEDRVMVDQLRFDLRFPNEKTTAGFCVKISFSSSPYPQLSLLLGCM